MKSIIFLLTSILTIFLITGTSWATSTSKSQAPGGLAVDFRNGPWNKSEGLSSYTYDNITIETNTGLLNHLWNDGLGIGNDEIGGDEQLTITIDDGMYLSGVWLTNIFSHDNNYKDSNGQRISEAGSVIVNGMVVNFSGTEDKIINPASNNPGDLWVAFGFNTPTLVESLVFKNSDFNIGNDFSVVGLAPIANPEPATMVLFGLGLLGIAGLGRKKLL